MSIATYLNENEMRFVPRCARPGCNRTRDEHHAETPACGTIPSPAWSGDGPCNGVHHEFVAPYLKPYYENVPGLGNVAVSRHAQARAEGDAITEKQFEDALFTGETIPDGMHEVFREKNGVRVVILLKPTPDRGAKLVKTVFRPKASTVVRRRIR
jgi:hypothetical protein